MSSSLSGPAVRRRAPFDGRRFRNLDPSGDRSVRDALKWMLNRQRVPWPQRMANTVVPAVPSAIAPDQIAVTFIGHSTFLIQTASTTTITDPVFVERASPVQWAGPRRVRAPGLAIEALPRLDFVLLSHNHYDHMDLASLRRLDAPIITTIGNRAYLRARGLTRVDELDWWQPVSPQTGVTVTLTPAQHFAARTPFDRNRTLWGGFVLESAGTRVFFAGDSGYATHFREVREAFGPPDLALLPIGAYEPRWLMKAAHMNPEDAVQAHLDLEARRSVAMHFGCFQLTDEPFDEPVRKLAEALDAAGLPREQFRVMEVGETVSSRCAGK